MRNVKLALRSLARTPYITAVAVFSIALGIGANAAIFSLVDQLLLQPLPVHEPDRLVNLSAPGPKPGKTACGPAGDCEDVFSYEMYLDLQSAGAGLFELAAHRSFPANLALDSEPASVDGMLVSGSYFPVLGLEPALGRLLGPADDQDPGGHPVAVLSHAYWEARMGADPLVLDRTIRINGHPFTVVGVAPAEFEGTTAGIRPGVFVSLAMRTQVVPWLESYDDRRSYWAYVFGRLGQGATPEQAERALNAVYAQILEEVEVPLQAGIGEQTLREFRRKEVEVEDGRRGQSVLHREVRTPLALLFSVAVAVFLIACANLANLLLVRGSHRRTEIAIRLSLGASRRRVVVQLLTESLVLAVMGGAAGLLVAEWMLRGIALILPPDLVPLITLDEIGSKAGVAAALVLVTGLLAGVAPALQSTRTDLLGALRAGAGHIASERAAAAFRNSLVVAQIALSAALLISAGLLLKSLSNVNRVDLGVRVDGVVSFAVSPARNGYSPERSQLLLERIEADLAARPGVSLVTSATSPILTGFSNGGQVSVEGFERGPDTDANARVNKVGPDYFRTMGTPLLAGRDFISADRMGAPRVAIVNEAFARKFGLGREAVGKRMAFGAGDLDIEIVGLARDSHLTGVKDPVPPLFVTPHRQDPQVDELYYYVRAGVNADAVLRQVPQVIADIDPNVPVQDLKLLGQQVRENVFLDRMIGGLAAAFAALATLLAAVGLYGVLSYAVASRTREIGIRMALGGSARRVRALVLGQVARMFAAGGIIGVAAALAVGRTIEPLLFDLDANDPLVVTTGITILGIVALAAGYFPAHRASQVEPAQALRNE